MIPQFKKLYRSYASGTITADEMPEFRSQLGSTSDDELWSMMLDASCYAHETGMPQAMKSLVADRLHVMIMRRRWYAVLRYAAAAAVVLCAGLGFHSLYTAPVPGQMLTTAVKAGSKSELTLPDGTRVQLNSASSVSFDIDDRHARTVRLTGEAFFDVAKDPKRPFRVMVGDMQVEVHGTTFNVNAYNVDRIETSLITGKVTISDPVLPAKSYTLSPGEKAVFCRADSSISISRADMHLATGWMEEYLVFDGEPLWSVVERIERWYGVDIELRRKDISSDSLTGSFRHENIHNVIYSLSLQYKFRYKIDKDHIIIY
ncbi:MAG: FecR domain-containing protein [Muribaculaceae bacterium]|nr:FecR domain-containing protein [Muribaculaceae bacterium]